VIQEKYKNAPFRAPMIIILVNTFKEHPKVPAIEQKLSTAAAAQNIMLSLNAMNYSAVWRTGKLAFNPFIAEHLGLLENQEILGYIYIGTTDGKNKKIPEIDVNKFITKL
jgi:nitroreductase